MFYLRYIKSDTFFVLVKRLVQIHSSKKLPSRFIKDYDFGEFYPLGLACNFYCTTL